MKKFIWNWKFKYALFTKKERVFFPFLIVSMIFLSFSSISALIPRYYDVNFYDAEKQLLFNHELKEGSDLDLREIMPGKNDETFYGWAMDPNAEDVRWHVLSLEESLDFYGVWGRFEEEVIDQELAFKEEKEDDDSLIKGEEKIGQEGQKGLKRMKYKNFMVGDRVVDTTLLSEEVVREPKNKIVLIGTMEEKIVQNEAPKENIQRAAPPASKPAPQEKPKAPAKQETQPTPAKEENSYVPIYGIEIIPNKFNDKFKDCKELRTVYPLGVPKGHPAYTNYPGGDRDKDGWACEVKGTPGGFYDN